MIYLVHHGDAVPAEVDPQRPLSVEGRTHVERLAARAAARGVQPAAIWHSGKLRARQTAETLWRTCNPLAELSAMRGLQPTDPPGLTKDLVAGESRDVMLVGHMPNLSRTAALLTTGSGDTAFDFPSHGIVAIEFEGERWVERWRLE